MESNRCTSALHVLARIGGTHCAVPVSQVCQVLPATVALQTLPRHHGAWVGMVDTASGPLPVVELERWVRIDPASDATDAPALLVLMLDGRRLGIRVQQLIGMRAIPAAQIHSLSHDEDPQELFERVARVDGALVHLLEADRLMNLLALWQGTATASNEPADEKLVGQQLSAQQPAAACAVVRIGQRWFALPAALCAAVLTRPPLCLAWTGGREALGIVEWRGHHLVMLDPAVLFGADASAPEARWMLVLSDEPGRALALPVDEHAGVVAVPSSARWAGNDAAHTLIDAQWPLPPAPGEAEEHPPCWVQHINVPRLLSLRPEAALAGDQGRREAQASGSGLRSSAERNNQPYMLIEADGCVAVPLADVAAVLRLGMHLQAGADHVSWKGENIPVTPLLGRRMAESGPGAALLVCGTAGQRRAVPVTRIISLVPSRAGLLSRMRTRQREGSQELLMLEDPPASYLIERLDALAPAALSA